MMIKAIALGLALGLAVFTVAVYPFATRRAAPPIVVAPSRPPAPAPPAPLAPIAPAPPLVARGVQPPIVAPRAPQTIDLAPGAAAIAADLLADPAGAMETAVATLTAPGFEDPRDVVGPLTDAEARQLDALDEQLATATLTMEQWAAGVTETLGKPRADAFFASALKSGQDLVRAHTLALGSQTP